MGQDAAGMLNEQAQQGVFGWGELDGLTRTRD